jgi:hypothetical protein
MPAIREMFHSGFESYSDHISFQRLQLGAKAILEEQIRPTLTQSSMPNDGVYFDGFDADNSIFE